MRLLVLHLSDSHFKDNYSITKQKLNAIVQSLVPHKNKLDECIIIFSGDIAYAGLHYQYSFAQNFLKDLVALLKNQIFPKRYIKIFIVPGNHDMAYSSTTTERGSIQIAEYFREIEKLNQVYMDKEPAFLEAFYTFAKRHQCFTNNNIISHHTLEFGQTKLRLNLVNTAFFSALDNDKGLHFLPEESVNSLYLSDEDEQFGIDVAITVMHHHYEWFHDTVKSALEHALHDGTSLLLLGHEHRTQTKNSSLDGHLAMTSILGGALSESDYTKSRFNLVILDFAANEIERLEQKWDQSASMYYTTRVLKSKLVRKSGSRNKPRPTQEFRNKLLEDSKHQISDSFLRYFVFPRLIREEYNKKESEICDFPSFLADLRKNKFLLLKGNDNSGKTSLLKYLYHNLIGEQVPLLFVPENITSKSINKIIKAVFEEQYGSDPLEYAKFQQLDNTKKTAIVDDVNKLSSENLIKLLEYLRPEFEYIILCSNDEWNFDIFESVKLEFEYQDNFCVYKLESFYSDKRTELIQNICCLQAENKSLDIENTVKTATDFINNQLRLFRRDPDFIIQYVMFLVNEKSHSGNSSVFGRVFENNITNAIQRVKPIESVDLIFKLLEDIAYYIHKYKKYPVHVSELTKIIEDYNRDYDDNINPKILFEKLSDAKILKYTGNNWDVQFCSNRYLSFFVAKKILSQYTNEGNNEMLSSVLKNICFGLNGDIVLFLSYLTQSTNLLDFIYSEAEEWLNNWEEYDLNNSGIKFLSKYNIELDISAPKENDKESFKKHKINAEKEIENNEQLETIGIYDYDEKDVVLMTNQLIKALKYTELIARSLPNFTYLLNKEKKQTIVNSIYKYPNKILYKWLNEIDTNFDQLLDELEEHFNSDIKDINSGVSREKIEAFVVAFVQMTTLSMFNSMADIASNKKTIKFLNDYMPEGKVNYKIQNILMEETAGNVDAFIEKILNEYKTNGHTVKVLLRHVAWKALLTNPKINKRNEQLLSTKLLGQGQRGNSQGNKNTVLLLNKIKKLRNKKH